MAAIWAFLVVLQLASSGCSLHSRGEMAIPAELPATTEVAGVPFYPQDEYQCGPATLAMALTWSGVPILPDELKASVYMPSEKGSLQSAMIASTRRHGRVAYELGDRDDLMVELTAGNPVIVLLNLGLSFYPVWHYAVVVGYDRASEEVVLNSGETENKRYSLGMMNALWGRADYWGLMVLPPSRLPDSAEELSWLKAALGLELAKQGAAAQEAYAVAVERWPMSHTAWMGLGNSSYSLGLYVEAAAAFEEATRLVPNDGVAFNNLATVLAKLGRYDEAIAAAERAVAFGGPHSEVFKKTLSEVRQHK